MNKLVIKDISIVNKNKKKTTGIKLENKDHKLVNLKDYFRTVKFIKKIYA